MRRSRAGADETATAVGYVRVSHVLQAREGISLDAQREKIVGWAEAHGYALVEVFEDAGISGGRADNRPGLAAALARTCSSKAALVVYSLSRLARSTRDALQISEKLDRSGADLVSISERIDTTSAAGRMVFRMLAVLAEFERDLVGERTRVAMQHLKAQGRRVGTIPFGYDLDADGETLSVNDSEQAAVSLMVDLRDRGESLRAIAAELKRRDIRTKNGNRSWGPKVIRDILVRQEQTVTTGASSWPSGSPASPCAAVSEPLLV